MRSWRRRDRATVCERKGDWRAPVVLGLAAFFAFPSVVAYSDVASLISGRDTGRIRWDAHLTTAPAGSVQSAEMPFREPILTGSISPSAGVTLPDGRRIAFQGKIGVPGTTPDEDRVTRSLKKGRVFAVAPVLPPAPFQAGSILDKQTSRIDTRYATLSRMAFVRSRIGGREIDIATAFYRRRPAPRTGIAGMLAGLVNNPQPDILATAYATSAPDYSRAFPLRVDPEGRQPAGPVHSAGLRR